MCGFVVFSLLVIPGYVMSTRSGAGELPPPPARPTSAADDVLQCTESVADEMVERLGSTLGALGREAADEGIDSHVRTAAARHGVSEELIVAMIEAESRFDPHAVSPRGALGLMQLMPATAAALGVRDPFDPRENIEAGVRHLRAMLQHFRGNLRLALAAYNAGEQAVIQHRGVPPYPETRRYVRRVMERASSIGKDIRSGGPRPMRRTVQAPAPLRLPRPYGGPLA